MSRTTIAARADLYEATRRGLEAVPKELPPVWLYDERGSRLYEDVSRLPDYYLPRLEAQILRSHAAEIARLTCAETLVELGSGNARNTRLLIDALRASTLARFVPVDVSEKMLHETARGIDAAYPEIAVTAQVADFESDLGSLPGGGPRLVAMLGSTIGNLHREQRAALFGRLAAALHDGDAFLVSIDLVKDVERLRAAYDDRGGVTEAFVRNALTALNRELDASFDQRRFRYDAAWDAQNEWMDIGLRATCAHSVSIECLSLELAFATGEWLRVEVSSKFRRPAFAVELERSGLRVETSWADPAQDFAIVLARPCG